MIDRILINNSNDFVFQSSDNSEFIFFSLSDFEQLKNIKKKLDDSIEVVFSFNLTKDNINIFLTLYNIFFDDINNERYIIVNFLESTDEQIKKYGNDLKELESITNCYFSYRYNMYDTARIDEILDSIDFIEEWAKIIKSYNLSPIENLMFIFDNIRSKKYFSEEDSDGVDVSRNLSKIIFSDKIVCTGYANLFSAIANKLGIYTEIVSWSSKDLFKNGHMSNICYVNDSVYDIHGIVEIDSTGIQNMENQTFFRDYTYFASSIDSACYRNQSKYRLNLSKNVNLIGDILEQYRICMKYENDILYDTFVSNLLKKIEKLRKIVCYNDGADIEKLFCILNLENNELIIQEVDSLMYKLESLFYEYYIPHDKFAKILYNVRKIKYSINNNKNNFSISELYNIIMIKYAGDKVFEKSSFTEDNLIELLSNDINFNMLFLDKPNDSMISDSYICNFKKTKKKIQINN